MNIQEFSNKMLGMEGIILTTGNKLMIIKYLNALGKLRTYLRELEREIVKGHGQGKVMINQIILDIYANSEDEKYKDLVGKCEIYDRGKILEKRMNKFLDILSSPNIDLSITEINKGKEESNDKTSTSHH